MHPRLALAVLVLAAAACGGSSPVSPVPTPTPTPLATPTPQATPTPVPTAVPSPLPTPEPTPTPCTQGLCEEPTSNTNRAVRLTLRLYTVVNGGGQIIRSITEKDAIPVGYTATVDVTAKDELGKDTLGQAPVTWTFFNDGGATVGGNHTHQRRITGDRAGTVLVTARQDGVTSNTVALQFE